MQDQPEDVASAAPVPLTPRRRAARRRHRRRVFGVLVFVLVAAGVFATAYFTLSGPDDASNDAVQSTELTTTTTTILVKPSGPYRVTTGVNVREGPGTTFPSAGTIELGHVVFVTCVTDGESVPGPKGPSTKWVRLAGFAAGGYLTVQYIELGTDLDTPGKIPVCSS